MWNNRNGCVLVMTLSMLLSLAISPLVLALDPEDAGDWDVGDPISVTVTAPDDDFWVWINSTLNVTASASDIDRYRCDEYSYEWYSYSDEVSSGETAQDHHIWWTCSEGSFTDEYGPSATYLAPDYVAGNDDRDVTITAHADDFNRGTDVLGFNDGAGLQAKDGKVK